MKKSFISISGFMFSLERGYRMASVATLLVTALVFWLCPSVAIAHAQTAAGFRITNLADGKCLDADSNNIASNGDTVQLWGCWGGINQAWNWQNCRANGLCELVNAADGKCLDADSNSIASNGDRVQLWNCWGGANQYWHISNAYANTYETSS